MPDSPVESSTMGYSEERSAAGANAVYQPVQTGGSEGPNGAAGRIDASRPMPMSSSPRAFLLQRGERAKQPVYLSDELVFLRGDRRGPGLLEELPRFVSPPEVEEGDGEIVA